MFVTFAGVVFGFLMGNPYAAIDFKRFYPDVVYVLQTTKYYAGENLYNGYRVIDERIIELVGKPTAMFLVILTVTSLMVLICSKKTRDSLLRIIVMNLSIIVPYFVFMGHSSFFPARYVLPVVPNLFLLTTPIVYVAVKKRWTPFLVIMIGSLLVFYNLFCVYEINSRFVNDPRMGAYTWLENNVANYSKIEASVNLPFVNQKFNKTIIVTEIPYIVERSKSFQKLFVNQSIVQNLIPYIDGIYEDTWFTLDNLYARNPDYILLNSGQFEENMISYPNVTEYYRKLLNEETKYVIVYDKKTPGVPNWCYPEYVDSLFNRMVILKKRNDKSDCVCTDKRNFLCVY
jgi:hypothetical protein